MEKRLIKPTPMPSGILKAPKNYDKALEGLYFLELMLYSLGIDKDSPPMNKHTFTRKHLPYT